ncbi:MAG: hypothetical protein ACLGGX_05850, partial [Bdellovibrionia bacterium]
MIKRALIGSLAILLVATSAQSQAENRDYLIEKLQKVYMSLAPADSSKLPVTLRLADLLAERARVQSMEELNNGCVQCVAGKADREKALSLYAEVIEKVPAANQSKVFLQMGHLYELTGR